MVDLGAEVLVGAGVGSSATAAGLATGLAVVVAGLAVLAGLAEVGLLLVALPVGLAVVLAGLAVPAGLVVVLADLVVAGRVWAEAEVVTSIDKASSRERRNVFMVLGVNGVNGRRERRLTQGPIVWDKAIRQPTPPSIA